MSYLVLGDDPIIQAGLEASDDLRKLKLAVRKATRLIGDAKTPKHPNLAKARRILLDALRETE